MKGRVIQVKNHELILENDVGLNIQAIIKGHFKQEFKTNTNFIKVGDFVEYENEDNHYRITKRLDRINKLSRLLPSSKATEQIIAANVDQLILISSFLEPNLKTGVIDRFITAAELFHIPIVLFFNKSDLVNIKAFKWLTDYYKTIVYQVIVGSTKKAKTIKELIHVFDNKVSVIAGQSGVGKTSLINAIEPNLDLKVNEISDYNQKGQHTTSSAYFYRLKKHKIAIIDTPGIKEFSLINVDSHELYQYFPEMMKLSELCKFYNCTHRDEPDCAIKHAVDDDIIPEFRYESYLLIFEELKAKEKNKWR